MPSSFVSRRNSMAEIGDLVRSYHKGYHVVTSKHSFESKDLDGNSIQVPQLGYTKVFDANFNPKRGSNSCAESYCDVMTIELLEKERAEKIAELEQGYDRIINYLMSQKK